MTPDIFRCREQWPSQQSLLFSLRVGQPGQGVESQGNKRSEGCLGSSLQVSELESCLLGCEESGTMSGMSAILSFRQL